MTATSNTSSGHGGGWWTSLANLASEDGTLSFDFHGLDGHAPDGTMGPASLVVDGLVHLPNITVNG